LVCNIHFMPFFPSYSWSFANTPLVEGRSGTHHEPLTDTQYGAGSC